MVYANAVLEAVSYMLFSKLAWHSAKQKPALFQTGLSVSFMSISGSFEGIYFIKHHQILTPTQDLQYEAPV